MKGKIMANKTVLSGYTMMCLILLAAYTLELVKKTRDLPYFVIFAVLDLVPLIITHVLYRRNKESNLMRYVMLFGYMIMYVYVLFTGVRNTFCYVIPFLVIIAVYSNKVYSILAASLSTGINIVYIIYTALTVGYSVSETAEMEIQLAAVLFVGLFSVMSSQTLSKIGNLKVDEVKEQEAKNEKLMTQILESANVIREKSAEIKQNADTLYETSSAIEVAMEEVSNGSSETAESIQGQIESTTTIQSYVDNVKQVSGNILEDISGASACIENGRTSFNGLVSSMEESKRAGVSASEEMQALNELVNNMGEIISLISNITKKTSLLALNASIEAARAGEAGKGFSVVAGEITSLSSQTASATQSISEIVSNITDRIMTTTEATGSLLKCTAEQEEYVNSAVEQFMTVGTEAQKTKARVEELEEIVARLDYANKEIVEAIQSMSAISEEVSAHAQTTYAGTVENNNIIRQIQESILVLAETADSLQQD